MSSQYVGRLRRVIIWLISIASVTASCAGASPTPVLPVDTATQAPSGAVAGSTAAAGPRLIADPVTIKDPKTDLVNGGGKKVAKNPHVDLTRLDASADGTELRVTLTMAGNVPAKISPARQELNYLVVIEADRSGVDDYWITVTNMKDGSWTPTHTDWVTSLSASGPRFPGSFAILDNTIVVTVSLAALGSPASLRLAAITQRADHKTGDVLAEDQVPKARSTSRLRPG